MKNSFESMVIGWLILIDAQLADAGWASLALTLISLVCFILSAFQAITERKEDNAS